MSYEQLSFLGRGPRSERGSEGEGRHVTEPGGLFGGRISGFQRDLETAVGVGSAVGCCGYRLRTEAFRLVSLMLLIFTSVLCSSRAIAVVPERFNRLSWSNIGAGTVEEFPLGVIAGGLRMARFISGTLINSSGRRLGHICNCALAACDCDSLVGASLGCQHWRRSPTLTA